MSKKEGQSVSLRGVDEAAELTMAAEARRRESRERGGGKREMVEGETQFPNPAPVQYKAFDRISSQSK